MPSIQLVAQPITHEAWAPYGHFFEGTDSPDKAAPGLFIKQIPHELPSHKFNRVAPITSTYNASDYPKDTPPTTALNVIRVGPNPLAKYGAEFPVNMFERHAATTQAFIPMGRTTAGHDSFTGTKGIQDSTPGGMLVLGCLNGPDDKPDLSTLKAFVTTPAQGVSYNAGIWHHSIVSFSYADFVSVDTQVTQDSSLKVDCEIVRPAEGAEPFAVVQLPSIA
ncbi:Allantoicase [Pseudohyphozyma bogoriensis]|nr:Allantoicase [Pseudohyphozyma bogoriensis]